MRPLISSLVIASLFVAGLAVDLNAAPAVEISRRVVGLFEPSRVDDLKQVVPTLPGVELVQVDYASTVAVWRLDPALVMTSYNAKKPPTEEQLAQRLDSLLGAASIRTFALKPLAGIPAEKATLVQLRPPILDCRGCRVAAAGVVGGGGGLSHLSLGRASPTPPHTTAPHPRSRAPRAPSLPSLCPCCPLTSAARGPACSAMHHPKVRVWRGRRRTARGPHALGRADAGGRGSGRARPRAAAGARAAHLPRSTRADARPPPPARAVPALARAPAVSTMPRDAPRGARGTD